MLYNEFQPNWILSPIQFINEYITLMEFNSENFVLQQILNQIKRGKKIDHEIAQILQANIGCSNEFWLNIQIQYDFNNNYLRSKSASQDLKDFKVILKELMRKNWLPVSDIEYLNEINLKHFFGLKYEDKFSIQRILDENVGIKLKKIGNYNISDINLALIIRKSILEASKGSQKYSFNKLKLIESLDIIKSLTVNKDLNKSIEILKEILYSCGVLFNYIEPLKDLPICGLAKHLDNGQALILITTKYNYEHNFWMTLFHELGHLILHPSDNLFLDDLNTDTTHYEREADNFMMSSFLKPYDFSNIEDYIDVSIFKKDKLKGWKNICHVSNSLGIAPSILLGILQKINLIPYSYYKSRYKKIIINH